MLNTSGTKKQVSIHKKILNREPILCDIRGLRYLQTKMGIWNGQNHIESGLSSARLASRCPYWPLIGPDNPWETSFGNFGPLRASQGMTRPVGSQLGHLKTILVMWGPLKVSMNLNLSISETQSVLQISQPLNIAQKWFCIHMDLSFQKKKMVSLFPRYYRNPILAFFLNSLFIMSWCVKVDFSSFFYVRALKWIQKGPRVRMYWNILE